MKRLYRNKYFINVIVGILFLCIFLLDYSPYPAILLAIHLILASYYLEYGGRKIRFIRYPLIAVFSMGLIFFIFEIIYPALFIRIFFSAINGQIIRSEEYEIKLPFPQWIILKTNENNTAYMVSTLGNSDAQAKIEPSNEEIDQWFNECTVISEKSKSYKEIDGIEYICEINSERQMFFISSDRRLFFIAYSFSNDQESEKDYALLLNSVKKKP